MNNNLYRQLIEKLSSTKSKYLLYQRTGIGPNSLLNYLKEKFYNTQKTIQQDYYAISSISIEPSLICAFRVTFKEEIISKAMPAIFINNIQVGIKKISNLEVLCYASKAINTKTERLVFKSGDYLYETANPYYIPENISIDKIIWQCEGNIKEKNIYINADCFPYKKVPVVYPFIFLINGKITGNFLGIFKPELKSIVVNTPGLNKKKCLCKNCVIKPAFDITVQIPLPRPTVTSLNNVFIKEIEFPSITCN